MQLQEIIHSWVDALNDGDVEHLINLYAEQAIYEPVGGKSIAGKAAIKERLQWEIDRQTVPCLIEDLFGEKEWVVLEWKDPLGLQATRFFHIINNKIIFQKNYWHSISYLKMNNIELPVDLDLGYPLEVWLTKFRIPKED